MEIYRCAKEGAQFIIVTHSPILLGIPDADIYCFDDGQIHLCSYEDTDSYQITKMFMDHRDVLLDRLLKDGPTSIFLAGKIGNDFSVAGIVVGILLLVIAGLLMLRKKK